MKPTTVTTDTFIQISESERELRDGNIAKVFRKFAIPSVVSLLFIGIQNIIDGAILGNYVGPNALASVSLVLPCFSFITALALIMGIGGQTIISICLGKIDRKGASNALKSALIFIITLSVAISALIMIFAREIATLLGANDILIDGSVTYITTLAPFFPILATMFFSDYILDPLGKPVYGMNVMLTTVVINIVLDLIFVAELGMGVFGAAISTGIAYTVGAALSIPILFLERKKIDIRKGKFSWTLVGKIFYNGSSEGISELSSGISILLFNITMMSYLGEIGVAAFTSLEYILFLCITIFLGISGGSVPIISYNFGAKNPKRIKKVLWLAAKTNLAIGITLFILLTVFGEQVVSLFFGDGEASSKVIEIASRGTSIYAIAFLFNGINILISGYFTAISNAKISIIISLLRGVVLIVPSILLLPKLIGIDGIWIAIPLAEIITFIVALFLIRKSLMSAKMSSN